MYDDFSNINGGENPHFTVVGMSKGGDIAAGTLSDKEELEKAKAEIKEKKDAKEKHDAGVAGPPAEDPDGESNKAMAKTDSNEAFSHAIPTDPDAAKE